MTIFLVHDKVMYTVASGKVEDFHNNLPAIRGDIQQMQDMHSENDQKRFERPQKWLIREQHGLTNVIIWGEEDFPVKKKKKRKVATDTMVTELIPFIRVPDAHGILLAHGDFDFEPNAVGEYELWDPYEGQGDIRENYPYAPDVYTTPGGTDIDLNNKIKSPKSNFNLPKISREFLRYSATERYPLLKYKEADLLYGGFYYPGYEWLDFEMPGEGYYDLDLASDSWFNYCTDDGNWQSQGWTQLSFKGNPVGPQATFISTAVDHIITSVGSSWAILPWGACSNMVDKWGCMARRRTWDVTWEWYPGMYFCTTNKPGVGTIVDVISSSYSQEHFYLDSYGSQKSLHSEAIQNLNGYGFVKLYEYDDRAVFCFNYYGHNSSRPMWAGIAEKGQVTLTDLKTALKDHEGNSYTQPWGQNHLGIVEVDKMLSRTEMTIQE